MNWRDSITVVCGFARSGSSLTMKMLASAEIPVHADNNDRSFKHPDMLKLPGEHKWLDNCVGKCVKILEPERWSPPHGKRYNFILCSRDPMEQAKSYIKFMYASEKIKPTGESIANIYRSMVEGYPVLRMFLLKYPGSSLIEVMFERTILRPVGTARRLVRYLKLPTDKIEVMASQAGRT